MPGIFISYRREDTAGYSGRIYDHLRAHFGEGRVFIDVDTIEPGEDFVRVIEEKVASCDALVAVIGPHWVAAPNETGARRLDDPHDFVRIEIATALARNIRVIPVLVGGARMPRFEELPESLAPLSRRNAIELSDTGFQQLLPRLIQAVEAVSVAADRAGRAMPLASGAKPDVDKRVQVQPTFSKRLLVYASVAVAILAFSVWLLWSSRAIDQAPRKKVSRDECVQGFVWREAVPNDHVCVTPQTRRQAISDNRAAASRISPTDRTHGNDTCARGYVWREAVPGDRVCVLPEVRQQVKEDNDAAASRRARP